MLDKDEIVMDAPSRDEGTLVGGDQLSKPWGKLERENLGKLLRGNMDKANRAVVERCGSVRPLRDHRDEYFVQPLESPPIERV